MEKKERKFYSELDLLRYQVRKMAEEKNIKIAGTNLMDTSECKLFIEALYRNKFIKELGFLGKIVNFFS